MARLLLDVMCGGLRVYCRMCGHDTVYALDRGIEDDDRIRDLAAGEDRRLVTRDRDLAADTEDSILLVSRDVEDQLRELRAAGLDLTLDDTPRYCGRCNGTLAPVEDDETPDYAPDPADRRCWRCRDCGQVFWKGSHWDRVRETLAGLDDPPA